MKAKLTSTRVTTVALLALLLNFLLLGVLAAAPIVVTYQGRVTAHGTNFTGTGQFKTVLATSADNITFTTVWSNDGTSSAGSEPVTAVSVSVTGGLFTLPLGDTSLANMAALDSALFTQMDLKLRIWFNDGVSGFVALNPPQRLTFAPYAAAVAATGLSGTYSNAVTFNHAANSFSGSGAGLTALNASNLSSGIVPSAVLGNAWKTTGNSGTTPGLQFIGTTDNQPLEFKANGERALRLEPRPTGAPNLIGGSRVNFVASEVVGAVIAGGGAENYLGAFYTNSVSGIFGAIGGGGANKIEVNAAFSTLGGGFQNTIGANASSSTIGGGNFNTIQTSDSTIGGGYFNAIQAGAQSTIGGGNFNTIQADDSTIGGGVQNSIEMNANLSAIGGGNFNRIYFNAFASTIGGGNHNASYSFTSTIGGGVLNTIQGPSSVSSTIGGGTSNTIENHADSSTIGGGYRNTNSGTYATVPGGDQNVAGTNSLAAGHRAKAVHPGSFVWADATDLDFSSTVANGFFARPVNGVTFVTGFDGGGATAGVRVIAGSSAWTTLSDRNSKTNLTQVNPRQVLERLVTIPVKTWNWKSQAPSVRHIGPMAQDFFAAFQVGEDEKHICTVDADGVALAAIQGLNEKVEEQRSELKQQQTEINQLKESVAALTALVSKLATEKTE